MNRFIKISLTSNTLKYIASSNYCNNFFDVVTWTYQYMAVSKKPDTVHGHPVHGQIFPMENLSMDNLSIYSDGL